MQMLVAHSYINVIQPQGPLNASNAAAFQSQLTAAVAASGQSILLVDMAAVESLDSAGLMALVAGLSLAQRLNKRFSLCSVSPAIRMIFELTGLDRVFEIFENRAVFEEASGLTPQASR